MDKRGNIVLDCIYDIATNFHEERARVVIFGNENGYINKQGEFVMQYAGSINTGGTANLHVVDGVEYRTGWSYKYGVVGYGVDKFRGLKDINDI